MLYKCIKNTTSYTLILKPLRRGIMKTIYKVIIAVVVIIAVTIGGVGALIITPFVSMADDITELNMEDANADQTKTMFLDYEESQMFIQKHPEYTEELHNLGLDYEYWLMADDATLKIDYNKESKESYIVYTCTDDAGEANSYDQNLKDELMSLC